MRGESLTAIIGGDVTVPQPVTYSPPRPKPKGLDWAKLRPADEPDTAPAAEVMPKTRASAYAQDTAAHEEARERVETLEARPTDTAPVEIHVSDAITPIVEEYRAKVADRVHDDHPVVRLLNATAPSTDPAVVSARALAVAALEHLRLVATPKTPEPATKPRSRRATRLPAAAADPDRIARARANTAAIVDAYSGGMTIDETAEHTGYNRGTVRRHLVAAGVQLRDDRHTRSGGANKRVDDPAEVEQVRAAYLDEGLSIFHVAERLQTTPKIVRGIMHRNGIEAREGQCGAGDTLQAIRDRIIALGATPASIRAWAWDNGVEVSTRGAVPNTVIDAYEAAHRE